MAEKREKACNEFIFWKGMSADGQGGHAKGAADKPISGYDAAYIFIRETFLKINICQRMAIHV